MFESCGGNFEGRKHGNGLQLIREYFQQRTCRRCRRKYSPEGIELVREEPGILVVRVSCNSCGEPLGIALVGVSTKQDGTTEKITPGSSGRIHGKQHLIPPAPHPADWSKADIKRLSPLSPISYDDVLDAHEFFNGLDSDWHRFLPERSRRQPRIKS